MAPRILISNDDGINAVGIKTLERIARTVSDDVWVVAPETNQSGAAHSLTLSRPLRVRRVGERHFAVDGTPTDCVLNHAGSTHLNDSSAPTVSQCAAAEREGFEPSIRF